MTTTQIQLTSVFTPFDGHRYKSYREFDAAVRSRFREDQQGFPSAFTYRDAINRAAAEGWVKVVDGQLHVDLPPVARAA